MWLSHYTVTVGFHALYWCFTGDEGGWVGRRWDHQTLARLWGDVCACQQLLLHLWVHLYCYQLWGLFTLSEYENENKKVCYLRDSNSPFYLRCHYRCGFRAQWTDTFSIHVCFGYFSNQIQWKMDFVLIGIIHTDVLRLRLCNLNDLSCRFVCITQSGFPLGLENLEKC